MDREANKDNRSAILSLQDQKMTIIDTRREDVKNPGNLPWRPEQPDAVLLLGGRRISGIFYQTQIMPSCSPSRHYVFEGTNAKITLWISADSKPTPTSCWLVETREYLSFDDFSIVVGGKEIRWWEDWWKVTPEAHTASKKQTPPSQSIPGARHLSLVK